MTLTAKALYEGKLSVAICGRITSFRQLLPRNGSAQLLATVSQVDVFAGSERERVTVKVPRHGGPFSDTDPILKTEFNRACALRSLVPGRVGFAGWKIWHFPVLL